MIHGTLGTCISGFQLCYKQNTLVSMVFAEGQRQFFWQSDALMCLPGKTSCLHGAFYDWCEDCVPLAGDSYLKFLSFLFNRVRPFKVYLAIYSCLVVQPIGCFTNNSMLCVIVCLHCIFYCRHSLHVSTYC